MAGCWFDLQDRTGRVRIDTKEAGFVVLDVPVGTRMTVGATVRREGETTSLAAVGLRY